MVISAEELVHQMVGPLEDIQLSMQRKLSHGHRGRPHDLTCRPFILHRNQWNSLVVDYSKVVREIKGELMRTLEAPIATLLALRSAMEAAERSFKECIVPHIWQTNDVSVRESKDFWGWGSVGLPAASQDESGNGEKLTANHEQQQVGGEQIRILMVGKRRNLPRILAQTLVGRYVLQDERGQYIYRDPAGSLEFVIHVIHVKEFEEEKAKTLHAVWYVFDALDHRVRVDRRVLQLLLKGYSEKLLLVMTHNDSRESQDKTLDDLLGVVSEEERRQSLRCSTIQNFKQDEAGLTELMDRTMTLMNRMLPSRCKGFCRAAHHYRHPRARHYHDAGDRPFLDYYFHACALHLNEQERQDVRAWLVRDALKHVLSPEIPHQHMDDLHITSTAVKQTLFWQQKAPATSQQVPQQHMENDLLRHANLDMSILVYSRSKEAFMTLPSMDREDFESARRFLDSQFMHEIDRQNSQFILRRLHRHQQNLSVDAKEPPVEPAYVGAAQFRKCDSSSSSSNSSSGKIAETDHSTIKSWSWISQSHRVAVKKGKSIIQPHEIDIQARVRHPNLLPLLCWTWKTEENNGNRTRRLVMELMDCDLDRWIEDAPIPLHVRVDVMLQIAKGMEYLHSHNIIHRDLKPANVLIRRDSSPSHLSSLRIKIADFGASKADFHTGSNPHSAKVGTAFYRAPEVMEEDGVYSKKVDVYSFAMVCYRILTGKTPFQSELEGDRIIPTVLRQEIQNDGRRPSLRRLGATFGAALKDMVEQCWHREAHSRPEFAQIAEFLRFMRVCALQLPSSRSRKREGEGGVKHSRPDIAAVLETKDLFRIFCSRIS